ncbi:MAG: hypothetical protein ABSF28_21855 [Terracidiphilus sp.]|jgi:hypothetical protein
MTRLKAQTRTIQFVAIALLTFPGALALPAQQVDSAALIQKIDNAALARINHVVSYTVIEHYSLYRNGDEAHPAAEMTVKTLYRKGVGKSYTILSQSGSSLLQKFVLAPLLDNEKSINQPGNVERSWFTSSNYEMNLKAGVNQHMNGHDCLAFDITPKRKAPNMLNGTLWVDAKDGSIVEIDGVSSRSPSMFSGPAKMMRQYTTMSGFAMATHARAESDSMLFGRTILTIDYSDYQLQLRPAN